MSRSKAPSTPREAVRNRLILGLLDHVGLRASDIANLRIQDVDLEEGELTVYRCGAPVALPFGPAVELLLEEQLDTLRSVAPEALLVPSSRRAPLSSAQIRRIARGGGVEENGAGASPHARRAAHGLGLLKRGADPEWVASRLGLSQLPRKWKQRKRRRLAAPIAGGQG